MATTPSLEFTRWQGYRPGYNKSPDCDSLQDIAGIRLPQALKICSIGKMSSRKNSHFSAPPSRPLESKNTKREKAWGLLSEGLKNNEISQRLNVHPTTVSQWRSLSKRTSEADFVLNRRVRSKGRARTLTDAEETKIRTGIETTYPAEGRLWNIKAVQTLCTKAFGKCLSEKTTSNYLRRWGYFKNGYIPLSLNGCANPGLRDWWKRVKQNTKLLLEESIVLWYNEVSLMRSEGSDNSARPRCVLAVATSRGALSWMVYAGSPSAKKRTDFFDRIIDSFEPKKVYLIHENPDVYSGRDEKKWLGHRKGEFEIWRLMDPTLSNRLNSIHWVFVKAKRLHRLLETLPPRQRQQALTQWQKQRNPLKDAQP